jgi:hypothetical protein
MYVCMYVYEYNDRFKEAATVAKETKYLQSRKDEIESEINIKYEMVPKLASRVEECTEEKAKTVDALREGNRDSAVERFHELLSKLLVLRKAHKAICEEIDLRAARLQEKRRRNGQSVFSDLNDCNNHSSEHEKYDDTTDESDSKSSLMLEPMMALLMSEIDGIMSEATSLKEEYELPEPLDAEEECDTSEPITGEILGNGHTSRCNDADALVDNTGRCDDQVSDSGSDPTAEGPDCCENDVNGGDANEHANAHDVDKDAVDYAHLQDTPAASVAATPTAPVAATPTAPVAATDDDDDDDDGGVVVLEPTCAEEQDSQREAEDEDEADKAVEAEERNEEKIAIEATETENGDDSQHAVQLAEALKMVSDINRLGDEVDAASAKEDYELAADLDEEIGKMQAQLRQLSDALEMTVQSIYDMHANQEDARHST